MGLMSDSAYGNKGSFSGRDKDSYGVEDQLVQLCPIVLPTHVLKLRVELFSDTADLFIDFKALFVVGIL